ncbi:MAG: hypothetical protein LUC98_08125 [Lachnospiraceae bacterium]|nr:hypothetical protein [Lachnospiraceae bacterium]
MEFVFIVVCILVAVGIIAALFLKSKKKAQKDESTNLMTREAENVISAPQKEEELKYAIPVDILPADTMPDESRLMEITDSNVLARINYLVPGLFQSGNSAINAAQAMRTNGEVLYRAIIPNSVKLDNSRSMEGAFRGSYHGTNRFQGNANWLEVETNQMPAAISNTAAAAMGIISLVVGQYYLSQITVGLNQIEDEMSTISNFQKKEYSSKVAGLVAQTQRISTFQLEILENEELRKSKIIQLDSLEKECIELLEQANQTIIGIANTTGLKYGDYEGKTSEAQNWFIYQEVLLEILCKICELRYTLHLGSVSRDYCSSLLPKYSQDVIDAQEQLKEWHQTNRKQLQIDIAKKHRKKTGLGGVVSFLPGQFNEELRFRPINKKTAKMIKIQSTGSKMIQYDNSGLYSEDIELIAKDGKVYYLQMADDT